MPTHWRKPRVALVHSATTSSEASTNLAHYFGGCLALDVVTGVSMVLFIPGVEQVVGALTSMFQLVVGIKFVQWTKNFLTMGLTVAAGNSVRDQEQMKIVRLFF